MKKYLILIGLALFMLALTVYSQAPALDDLGTALVNHGQDATTAGPTAAVIEVALANNSALQSRLTADENNITGLLAQGSNQNNTIAALQGTEANDAENISALQSQVATLSTPPAPVFPQQLAYKAFRGQTTAIAQSTIATPTVTATYNITLAANCTGTGSLAVHVMGTSSLGQAWTENLAPACANSGVNQNQTFSISSGSPITLSTAITGAPTYDVAISVVQLGAN